MARDLAARRAAFRELHREGCFVLPNPWDVGSAVRLERMRSVVSTICKSTLESPASVLGGNPVCPSRTSKATPASVVAKAWLIAASG